MKFRIPHSAIGILLLGACTPASTRPQFPPVPEALHAVVNKAPADVIREASDMLVADTIAIKHMSLRDAWLETAEFAGTHRIRLWADPDVTGKSRVTIEAVYRPMEDPSRTPRDLERAAPAGSPGQLRAAQLLTALKDKLGATTY